MSLPHQYQKTRRAKMGIYDCDCINNLEYERSKRRKKLFHITPQKQNGCILTEFGDCSYNETGCSDCTIKKKIRNAQKYKEESPEEVAADMASTSPFVIETWCSLLKGLNRAGYIICKKI